MKYEHRTVLLSETVAGLHVQPGDFVIDATVGGGGHSEDILTKTAPNGRLLALDQDEEALAAARERLRNFGERVTFVHTNFDTLLTTYAAYAANQSVRAIVIDLGVSAHQFRDPNRGFSLQSDGPLDMRMNPSESTTTAYEIVNTWKPEKIARIIHDYGEERFARRIAFAIVKTRKEKKINTTRELAELIATHLPKTHLRIHPATRTFQALRIAVNRELERLEKTLPQALDILASGGRLAILSFHSLEDRIVKNFFQRERKDCLCPAEFPACRCGHKARLKPVTKKPITASPDELRVNPASRSAKLRIVEKI